MSGVVSGAGKQAWGFLINAASFGALALPAAFLLGFYFKLGVEGLYWGMTLGPITQCACYAALIWRLRWWQEAEAALRRVQEAIGSL
jgi:MATE family multidrug resistance protein